MCLLLLVRLVKLPIHRSRVKWVKKIVIYYQIIILRLSTNTKFYTYERTDVYETYKFLTTKLCSKCRHVNRGVKRIKCCPSVRIFFFRTDGQQNADILTDVRVHLTPLNVIRISQLPHRYLFCPNDNWLISIVMWMQASTFCILWNAKSIKLQLIHTSIEIRN